MFQRRSVAALAALLGLFVLNGCAPPPSGGSNNVAGGGPIGGIPFIPDLSNQLADAIIQSKGTVDETPADYGYAYTDFEVASANGMTLRGWFVPADDSDRTVVFHQGNNGNKSNYLLALSVFVPNGYNVIFYDYQGFGDSDGDSDFNTLLEDALAVHAWAVANVGGRFVSMGASLGGPSAMHAARHAENVDALILDSPLVVAELSLYYLDELLGLNFDASMQPAAESIILSQFPAAFDLVREAPLVGVATYMVQGQADIVTPPEGAQRVYDALVVAKDLWMTVSQHGGSIKDFPDEYTDRVVTFLAGVFD